MIEKKWWITERGKKKGWKRFGQKEERWILEMGGVSLWRAAQDWFIRRQAGTKEWEKGWDWKENKIKTKRIRYIYIYIQRRGRRRHSKEEWELKNKMCWGKNGGKDKTEWEEKILLEVMK